MADEAFRIILSTDLQNCSFRQWFLDYFQVITQLPQFLYISNEANYLLPVAQRHFVEWNEALVVEFSLETIQMQKNTIREIQIDK